MIDFKEKALRDVFGSYLVKLGKNNKKICVVSCDLKSATKTSGFFKTFPKRSFEVGIAEANGIGVATGLALKGFGDTILALDFLAGCNGCCVVRPLCDEPEFTRQDYSGGR